MSSFMLNDDVDIHTFNSLGLFFFVSPPTPSRNVTGFSKMKRIYCLHVRHQYHIHFAGINIILSTEIRGKKHMKHQL